MGKFQRNLDFIIFLISYWILVFREMFYIGPLRLKLFYLQSGQNLICTDSNMEVSLDLILLR